MALANATFLAFLLAARADPGVVEDRVRTAFRAGELTADDYRPFDARRGWHQYNDCIVLQMLSSREGSLLDRKLAPVVRVAGDDWTGQCAVLRALVVDGTDPGELEAFPYARYWHGYLVPAAVGLRLGELLHLRLGLQFAVWMGIVLLAISAALRGGERVREAGLLIALAAATVWAVPYFSPSITHGPGDAFLLLGAAAVATRPALARKRATIVPLAAVFGSGVAYLDMLTGQLPIGAAWLGALVLAAWWDGAEARKTGFSGEKSPLPLVAEALLAFGAGAALTVIVKQALSIALADPGAAEPFIANLRLYMGVPPPENGWPGIALPFGRMVRQASVLTYGSAGAGYVLVGSTGAAWAVGAWRAWKARRSAGGKAVLVVLTLAAIPLVWILLFPFHTYVHAPFMVRILIVPVTLSSLGLLWSRPTAIDRDRSGLI